MNPRVLELAKDHFYLGCPTQYDPMSFLGKLDFFYKAAHQDGQRAMRERAAKVAEEIRQVGKSGDDIRNLEIE